MGNNFQLFTGYSQFRHETHRPEPSTIGRRCKTNMNEAPFPENGISAQTRRYLPWLVAVALFMENLDTTIVNTAVPTMAAGLNVPPLSLKAVLTSYTISLAVFIPISGWMADRYG